MVRVPGVRPARKGADAPWGSEGQSEGRAVLRPHRGLYGWLLAHGRRRPLERAPANAEIDGLGNVFPADLARGLAELWSKGRRIPQESFGIEQLSGVEADFAAPDAG